MSRIIFQESYIVVVPTFDKTATHKHPFMHLFFGTGQLKNPALFGINPKEISEGYSATETKREDAKFGVLD